MFVNLKPYAYEASERNEIMDHHLDKVVKGRWSQLPNDSWDQQLEIALLEEATPVSPRVTWYILKWCESPLVRQVEEIRAVSKNDLNNLKIRRGRPACIVERIPSRVTANKDGHLGFIHQES